MLEHGAIGKHVVKLERIAIRVLAKIFAVIVEGTALFVSFGISLALSDDSYTFNR